MVGVSSEGLKRHLRVYDILVALVGVWVLITIGNNFLRSADEYFVVNLVDINDHVEDTIGGVVYDRDIKRPFFGSWQAEIKSIRDERVVCTARGTHNYKVDEIISERNMDWYLERNCHLEPGQYLISTQWDLDITCWRPGCNIVRNTSNVFTVFSKEEFDRRLERDRAHGPRLTPFDPQ